jgi:hypothetical protein
MICQFLEKNKNITHAFLKGNGMNDEAATAVGRMLSKNDTLQELCINPRVVAAAAPPKEEGRGGGYSLSSNSSRSSSHHNEVTWVAAIKVCIGLYNNRSLCHLHFTVPNFSATDEGIWYLMCLNVPVRHPYATLRMHIHL